MGLWLRPRMDRSSPLSPGGSTESYGWHGQPQRPGAESAAMKMVIKLGLNCHRRMESSRDCASHCFRRPGRSVVASLPGWQWSRIQQRCLQDDRGLNTGRKMATMASPRSWILNLLKEEGHTEGGETSLNQSTHPPSLSWLETCP